MNDLLATLRAAHAALADPVLCDKPCRECDQRRALLAALTEQIAAVERDAWEKSRNPIAGERMLGYASGAYEEIKAGNFGRAGLLWATRTGERFQPQYLRPLPAPPPC